MRALWAIRLDRTAGQRPPLLAKHIDTRRGTVDNSCIVVCHPSTAVCEGGSLCKL